MRVAIRLTGTLLLGALSWAQFQFGSLTGVVKDQSQSHVPGALVEIRSETTNVARQLTTTSAGEYNFLSLPPGLWRGFENISDEDAWLFAVLEPHDVYASKDPYWAQSVVDQAREYGFEADDMGKMIKPHNYAELRAQMMAKLNHEGE